MRIAVSGTHSVGKSTLVQDLLQALPGYLHEPEPYRALRDHYPIKFQKDSTRYCNGLQTYYSITRVMSYPTSASNVIFDRAPIDYIPYSQYTARYHQTDLDETFIQSLIGPINQSLSHLDLIIFVPISKHHPMHLEADGIRPIDPHYRTQVDHDFKAIYRDAAFKLFPPSTSTQAPAPTTTPKILEVQGPRQDRISQVKDALLQLV